MNIQINMEPLAEIVERNESNEWKERHNIHIQDFLEWNDIARRRGLFTSDKVSFWIFVKLFLKKKKLNLE